jgi:hypothetical protein
MNYRQKYLKYKSKYYRLVDKMIGGTKTLEQIEQEVNKCKAAAGSDDRKIINCIETSGKDFVLNKINSNSSLRCHVAKGSKKYHILDTESSTCEKISNVDLKPEFNWHNYKEHFGDSQKAVVYAFRTNLIDELIKFIFKHYPQCANETCKFIPSGSTGPEATLNSDYDLTLAGNYKISVIIQMFNSIFEHEFSKTSAEIFDTNLYGYSFLINKAAIGSNPLWTPVLQSKPDGLQGLIIGEEKSVDQDKWAYLRIKSFYEKEKSNGDLTNVLTAVSHSTHDKIFNAHNINTMPVGGSTGKQENYLIQMRSFENQMVTPQTKEKMIDTLSNMNYFGDETYFTQGAFVHVVGLMYFKTETEQNKKGLFSKKYYLIHSMAENLAYFIHAFYNHHNDIIYAIKYFYRFINALSWLEKIEGKNTPGLEQLNNFTDWIKSKIRNRSEDEVLNYIFKNMSEMTAHGLQAPVSRNSTNLGAITEPIKTKLQNDVRAFVNTYTNVSVSETGIAKFYLIASLEILKQVIANNALLTNLKIDKSGPGKFTISCN